LLNGLVAANQVEEKKEEKKESENKQEKKKPGPPPIEVVHPEIITVATDFLRQHGFTYAAARYDDCLTVVVAVIVDFDFIDVNTAMLLLVVLLSNNYKCTL
jgi:hypothetical protein